MRNGIQVTQEGVGVERASDYQKVLDSRWLFMETGLEVDTTVTLPGMGPMTGNGYQRVNVARHNMTRKGRPYVPAFHGSYKIQEETDPFDNNGTLGCDDQWLYYYRSYFNGQTLDTFTIDVKAKIYTLPILEDYLAPKEIAPASAKSSSKFGVRALDGTDSAVSIEDTSAHGFSIDTRKKILSVHKVTTKKINWNFYNTARATAVDTTTDIVTIGIDPNGQEDPEGNKSGTSWVETGVQISWSPADFTTYPAPVSSSVSLYVIKVSDTQIKLALSKANAEAGIAINLTSAGSLPASLRDAGNTDLSRILHENDYPPSYLFCDVIPNNINGSGQAVSSLFHISTTPLVLADTQYLYFKGVQAVYISYIALIILKDPIEVAQ